MLSTAIQFSPDSENAFFLEIPASPAVFLLQGEGEPYASRTSDLRRRLRRLLGPPEQSRRLNLRDRVRQLEFTQTGSDFESQLLLYQLLRRLFPKTYSARLRLRPAPLIKLHLENQYPRASVTTRLGRLQPPHHSSDRRNLYYGPFPSRAVAEKFASDALDLFKMRRCVEDLRPDPAFPGCIYSEMKMCLAPCFRGCTDDEYKAEVVRVETFLDTSGLSLSRELEVERDSASADLAFERASAAHARLDKLKSALSQLPEIVRRIDRLRALVIQPAPAPESIRSVSLFLFQGCAFHGPIEFDMGEQSAGQSMEGRLQAAIQAFPVPPARPAQEHMEHLAILRRWYYRSHRVGEIFFDDEKGRWPLRRIARGLGRVARQEPAATGQPAQQEE